MSLDEKLEFFQFLTKIGFKEIEVGFPAASETEYELLRTLIDKDMIPDDTTVQVLTQSRKHIIKKLIEGNRLEAVISMPSGVFRPYANVSTAILIFTKTGHGGTE